MSFPNPTGKKVAVIGSRTFDDKHLLYNYLTERKERIQLIVSGGARGADTLATQWASEFGIPYMVFPAKWRDPITLEFDRGAGFRRNRFIIANCDVVLCFWDGESGGTKNSIDIANQLNKPVQIIKFKPLPKNAQEAVSNKLADLEL